MTNTQRQVDPPFLLVNSLPIERGGVEVCAPVSFEMGSGEAVFLKGSNGSGKTTALRTLAGVQGESLLSEYNLKTHYVGHQNALMPELTVVENLSHWAELTDASGSVGAALEAMRLQALADKRVKLLSAGQKRKASLARLFLDQADLWLLDEPTNHLDEVAAKHFWQLADQFLEKGGMIIAAIHEATPKLRKSSVCQLHSLSSS